MIKYGVDNSEVKESSLREEDLKKKNKEEIEEERAKKIERPPFLDRTTPKRPT